MTTIPPSTPPEYRRGSELLALAFGTTLAMWTVGYVSRFPGVGAPSWLLMVLMHACLIAGGWVGGRHAGRGFGGGLRAGLLVGALNLLILGSLLADPHEPNRLIPSAVWWAPGSLLLAGLLGAGGALLGRAGSGRGGETPTLVRHGLPAFATVAAAATLLLIVAGGIVTGNQAGLAVVDWPNSYGYNMFLYPLARMTGGIYYEHVHRLLGSLVGLTTLVLALHLWRVEDRPRLRLLGLVALVLVIVQGLLGGLRVTGHFTLSDDPAVTRPNLWLAVVHGVLGQVFFGVMVAIAAMATRRWRRSGAVPAGLDHRLAVWLLAALLLQIALGAVLRHTDAGLLAHITLAVLVLGLGVWLGGRLAAGQAARPPLRRLGQLLIHGFSGQLLLGFAALIVRDRTTAAGDPHPIGVAVTTLHQALGALLLATVVLALLWTRRAERSAAAAGDEPATS